MIISRLKIQNFKVFKSKEIDFQSSNLVMLDGPNGFGKTSIYDAIELLFTGQIRRYEELRKQTIDGRNTYVESPFYHEDGEGDIIICAEFKKGEETYVIERVAKYEELEPKVSFQNYNLYSKESFLSEERTPIANEVVFLSAILGTDYKENFEFLNYVEQEDSIYLLKNHDKNRKECIAHLFNVSDFQQKIDKLKIIKRLNDENCDDERKKNLDNLANEIRDIEEILSNQFDNTNYTRLIATRSLDWDSEDFDFTSTNYSDLFADDGILPRLRNFIENKEDFKQMLVNDGVSRIVRDEERLKNFLIYYNFVEQKSQLTELKNYVEKLKEYNELFDSIEVQHLKTAVLELDEAILTFVSEEVISEYNDKLKSLQDDLKELNDLEAVYFDLYESRKSLIISLEQLLHEHDQSTDICPLCGYHWSNVSELLTNIEKQTENINSIIAERSKRFILKLEAFKGGVVKNLQDQIIKEISASPVDSTFVNQLIRFDDPYFNDFLLEFKRLSYDFSRYLNSIASSTVEVNLEAIRSELTALTSNIENESIRSYFSEYYALFFNSQINNLDSLEIENVDKKISFLKYRYSILQNELLSTKKKLFSESLEIYTNSKLISTRLKALIGLYKSSLEKYQEKVIKDIEIIFHIYSARIMQDFQGGLGLFISTDRNGIKFQRNPNQTFDAIFSMSSGQLAALIISFTLALNKKYSQNKIILIDDPVQSMDELNIVGFVELLRNEFSEHQLIISTHEDKMSAYMRYKFKNYGLIQTRINLKELQNFTHDSEN